MARAKYKIDPIQVEKAWKRSGFKNLKDVFKDATGNENGFMRYDSAQKKINSGSVSYTIMDFLSKRLNCPYEYLSGELSDRDVADWGMPHPLFSKYQDFLDMTDEEKEQYYLNLVLDLGIADKWMNMNNRQRSNCHAIIKEFINWLLDYIQPDDSTYRELFEFFEKTGVKLDGRPEKRQQILNRMRDNALISIKDIK